MPVTYHEIVYIAVADPYARIIRICDGYVWDSGSTETMLSNTSWANSRIQLTNNSTIGGIPITIPSALPAGEYHMAVYDNYTSGSADDIPERVIRFKWNGNTLISIHPKMKSEDVI